MLIEIGPASVRIAVFTFFIAAITSALGHLPIEICCKRALIAAAIMFFVSKYMIKAVNFIMVSSITGPTNMGNKTDKQ